MCALKDKLEADLTRAVALHVTQKGVTQKGALKAQFRIISHEADYRLAVRLPQIDTDRSALFARLRTYMAWKQATAFTMVTELREPDCVAAFGVSYNAIYCCCVPLDIARPFAAETYGEVVWLPGERAIGDDILNLLPRSAKAISQEEISQMERAFGRTGDLPTVRIARDS